MDIFYLLGVSGHTTSALHDQQDGRSWDHHHPLPVLPGSVQSSLPHQLDMEVLLWGVLWYDCHRCWSGADHPLLRLLLFVCNKSTERKEAESASLSAKEECFGRLKSGDWRGGGRAADTSDSPIPPISAVTSSSSPPTSVRCLRQRASGSHWLIQNQWNWNTFSSCSLACRFLFDASCLNFFYYSV